MAGWQAQLDDSARETLGRALLPPERENFTKYMDLLMRWQRVHRLTGSADPSWIVTELFADSLLFLRVVPPTAKRILDFGSGAGFPGVPIAIVRRDVAVTLLEARQRRASFLSAVVRELPLPNASVRGARAEDALRDLGGAFDAVVMRCAGPASEVAPLAAAFASEGGVVVASGPPMTSQVAHGRWIEMPSFKGRPPRRFLVDQR